MNDMDRLYTTPATPIIMPDTEMNLKRAVKFIFGYCNKHDRCDDACMLYDEEAGCEMKNLPPCDWDRIIKEEEA